MNEVLSLAGILQLKNINLNLAKENSLGDTLARLRILKI